MLAKGEDRAVGVEAITKRFESMFPGSVLHLRMVQALFPMADAEFAATRVKISSMLSRADLVGRTGIIDRVKNGRALVRLEGASSEEINVKITNLSLVDEVCAFRGEVRNQQWSDVVLLCCATGLNELG